MQQLHSREVHVFSGYITACSILSLCQRHYAENVPFCRVQIKIVKTFLLSISFLSHTHIRHITHAHTHHTHTPCVENHVHLSVRAFAQSLYNTTHLLFSKKQQATDTFFFLFLIFIFHEIFYKANIETKRKVWQQATIKTVIPTFVFSSTHMCTTLYFKLSPRSFSTYSPKTGTDKGSPSLTQAQATSTRTRTHPYPHTVLWQIKCTVY